MNNSTNRPLLCLASNSPRRRELLALGGWSFWVQATDVDESVLPEESAPDYVLRLAQTKAQQVARQLKEAAVVLAADTTVVHAGCILGKPQSPAQAVEMLRRLRGHTHQVFSAIAAVRVEDGFLLSEVCVTEVSVRDYTDAEIAAYVASGDPLDKAGAYGIQNREFHPVEEWRGCFANVMGLPLCHLSRLLSQMGMPPDENIPEVCQAALAYDCKVYPLILTESQPGRK